MEKYNETWTRIKLLSVKYNHLEKRIGSLNIQISKYINDCKELEAIWANMDPLPNKEEILINIEETLTNKEESLTNKEEPLKISEEQNSNLPPQQPDEPSSNQASQEGSQ